MKPSSIFQACSNGSFKPKSTIKEMSLRQKTPSRTRCFSRGWKRNNKFFFICLWLIQFVVITERTQFCVFLNIYLQTAKEAKEQKNIREEFSEFVQETSFTAILRIYKAQSYITRVTWIVLTLAMVTWMIVQCSWLLEKYFRYPIEVSIVLSTMLLNLNT